MKCPKCGGPTKVSVSRPHTPGPNDTEGRTYRYRRCAQDTCDGRISSVEVPLASLEDPTLFLPPKSEPVLQASGDRPLIDLEGGLEEGLENALKTIRIAVDPLEPPLDKSKIELSRWLIEDRRKWRLDLASQAARTGQTSTDPQIAQLATVLKLVAAGEDE